MTGAAQQVPAKETPETAKNDFGRIQSSKDACKGVATRHKKEHLQALPTKVIDPPRTAAGWPDFQGGWTAGAYALNGIHSIELGNDPAGNVIQCEDNDNVGSLLIDSQTGLIPYNAEAQAKKMEYLAAIYAPTKRMDNDTDVLCFFRGVPHDMTAGNFRMDYIPGYVVLTSLGVGSPTRIIPMDNGKHIPDGVKLMMGDPVGHWEGKTLVVETTNNSGDTWFDKHGTWHSEQLRVVEQWTLVDQNTMYYQATVYDPKVFTHPWSLAMTFNKMPATDTFTTREEACHAGDAFGGFAERNVRAGQRATVVGVHGYHIHVNLETGKAVNPAEQKYLDESGQPPGLSYAPMIK
jgi:hypothetical protein